MIQLQILAEIKNNEIFNTYNKSQSYITNSAVEITTGLISHLSEDDMTDYGEALRLSVLDLIANKEAGYTHPYFWAPFLIIGVN